MNRQNLKGVGTRAIQYCRSAVGDKNELQRQITGLSEYAQAQGFTVTDTFMESGTMGTLTYHSLRLRAKYRVFDILLVTELDVLGNNAIEITQEVDFLTENGVEIISMKDGALNAETLPTLFRKKFGFVK